MEEEGKPTGITHEEAVEAAQHSGSVDFEGRPARVVGFVDTAQLGAPYTARLELDLGDEYLVLFGYFSDGEFMETGRERPF